MGEISYQNKDIASKVTGEALIGKSLAPFGLPHLKIMGALPTNLPVIESNELRLDNLFLLNDGSLAIIDYESDFSRENFIKYLNYIARVLKRYSLRKELNLLKQIRIIVIYTADVECTEETYDLGGLILKVEAAYLIHMDSEEIRSRISHKVRNGLPLSEEELMELMILPLTVRGEDAKQEYIFKSVELAKALPNHADTVKVLSGILTFSDKVIDKNYARLLKEEMRMTQVEQLLFEEACEKVYEEVSRRMSEDVNRACEKVSKRVYEEAREKAYEDMSEKAYKEAREKVAEQLKSEDISVFINLYRELRATREETLRRLMTKYSLTESEGNRYLEQCWG